MRPDPMQDHRTPTDPIDKQKVGSKVVLRKATPVILALSEAMFTEDRWKPLGRNQGIKDLLERFGVEFGVLTGIPVIALETLENH